MATKTYTASTMKEAMDKVKKELGDDALIVSDRMIKKKTLTQEGLYEVVVQIPNNPPKKNHIKEDNEVLLKISNAAKQINEISNHNITEETNQNNIIGVKNLQKEIQEISNTMRLLQSTIWDMNDGCRSNLIIPPEFSEIYAISKNSGMKKEHLDEIMSLTLKLMPLKMRQNPITIKRYFDTLLRRMILIKKERDLSTGTKKIMMFVGPTGVGKTTTIAKLAARYAIKGERKYKVGIITLDTYRIGAVEQLMTYARMMKLPIEAVVDPSDFEEALNRLRNNDIILIDTVGSSQHDKEKLEKLNLFLGVNTFATIDVNLVLSATTKYEDLKDIYNNFSILNIDSLLFTKLDETQKTGNIFSLIYDVKKTLNYFSIGQEVPDDLIVANSGYLIEEMLKDIK
jgi:flagellar biosynthesis protein FlhF